MIPGSDNDESIVDSALRWHTANVRVALAQFEQGMNLPTFKAIFKTGQYFGTISGVLYRSLRAIEKAPFICIRSEAEALGWELEYQVPDLWQLCNIGRPTWPTQTALFLCPEFLRRGQAPGGPSFDACPGIAENKFYTVPNEPLLFADRGLEITRYTLIIQQFFDPYHTSDDPDVYMNLPLAWSAEEACQRMLSYLMYIQCGSKTLFALLLNRADNVAVTKNACVEIPDVTQPPWNFPPSLNGSSLGSDSTTDIGANATLAINLPQPLASPASLVQGTPVDSIGTS